MAIANDPTEKGSHADQAYEEVLRRLRTGQFSASDRVVDKVLAAELDMSRMPAREALLRLVNEGYLVGTARGFRLPTLSVTDIMEIFEIRKLLEPRAAASACCMLDESALGDLRAAYTDAVRAHAEQNVAKLKRANTDFRVVWLEAVPSRRMVATISRFFDHVNAIRSATLHDPIARELSVSLLATILDGFARRDPLYVHDQMLSFIEAARMRFIELQDAYSSDLGLEVA